MKKFAALILAVLLCAAVFAGCGDGGNSSSGGSGSSQNGEKKKIGIVQISDHASLNTIRDATIGQLEKLGYKDGDTAEIEALSAQSEATNVTTILNNFVSGGKDIVIAITTPVASSALNIANEVPVVFSAVSDPVATKLTTSLEKPDKNVTGTSDAVPVGRIFDMALELTPNVKTVGLLYNNGEASSVANIAAAKEYCDKKGLKYVEAGVTTSTEVQQAAQSLVTKCDAIFTPTDNTVADAMTVLAQITKDAKIPCYVGADSMVNDGGFATIGIKYEDLGIETANMADKVLKGTPVSDIPIKVFDDLSTYVNTDTAKAIGVEIPDSILKNEKTVIFPQQ